MLVKCYRDLWVYQRAFKAAMRIFEVSKAWPVEERYSLTDQIRRSSRSVCGAIAEAWRKRRYEAHFVSKLSDGDGEAAETQNWLAFAKACSYLAEEDLCVLDDEYDAISGGLVSMMNSPAQWCGPARAVREECAEYGSVGEREKRSVGVWACGSVGEREEQTERQSSLLRRPHVHTSTRPHFCLRRPNAHTSARPHFCLRRPNVQTSTRPHAHPRSSSEGHRMTLFKHWSIRYAIALAAALVGVLLRSWLTSIVGPGLPTYITFYPCVMLAALAFGFGPGLVATLASALAVDYLLLPPVGSFSVASRVDAVGMVFFTGMGILMSLIAGLYGRLRHRLASLVAERTLELRDANDSLRQQAELVDPARAEVILREMQRVVRARREMVAPPAAPEATGLWRLPAAAGVFAVTVGLLGLAGWAAGLEIPKSVLPGLAAMKANTALCFVLSGLALILRERRGFRLACASVAGSVGLLTIAEYATGMSFGIDQLLFRDPGDLETVYMGRMAPATAMGFIFTAIATLLLRARAPSVRRTGQTVAMATGVVGMIAVVGYVFDDLAFYALGGSSSMALNTAISFIALAAGLIFARRDGFGAVLAGQNIGAQFARRLLPAILLVPIATGWLFEVGVSQGIYGERFDMALATLTMMLSLSVLVWWIAGALGRVEATRQETEAQLRSQSELMDQAIEALIVRELDGAIRSWNRGAADLYGWTAAEALGQRIHVLLRTEGLPADHEADLEKTGHWRGELVHTARDGRRVIVESRKTAIRSADGRVLILESNRDITERRKSELSLRESEERLRRAQEIGHLGSWELDLVKNHLVWSDEVYRIFGLQPQEFAATYEAFLEHVHPDDRAAVDAAYSDSLRENRDAYEIEHRVIRKGTGEVRTVHERCQHFRDGSGKVIRSIGMVHDITERKQAEEAARKLNADLAKQTAELKLANEAMRKSRLAALNLMEDAVAAREKEERISADLRESQERLALATSGTGIGMFDWDIDTGSLLWTEPMAMLMGVRAASATSSTSTLSLSYKYSDWRGRVHPDDLKRFEAETERCMAARLQFDLEHRVVWQDGSVHWVAARGVFQGDVHGKPQRMVGIIMDITERKAIQKQIEDLSRFPAESMNPMLRVDGDGILLYANRASDGILGTWGTGVGQKVPSSWDAVVGGALQQGSPTTMEAAFGSRSYSIHLVPVTGRGYVNLYGTDITPLKEAQAREKAAVAHASAAQSAIETVNAMTEGVALLNLDGTIVSVNPAIEALTGMATLQLAGQNIKTLLPRFLEGADLASARSALENLGRGVAPELGLMSLTIGEQRRMQVIPDIALIQSRDGLPTMAVLTLSDVTQLMEATELFEKIFDNTHILIAYLDTKFRFIRVNQAFAADEGQAATRFVGRNYFELHPSEEDREIFHRVLATGETYSADERAIDRPDHLGRTPTYWDWSVQPLKDSVGRAEGLLLCLLDVTERKLAQERDRVIGQLLELFLRKTGRQEYLDAVVRLLQHWSGYHCVGVRALDGDGHIPYAAHVGFSEEFWRKENQLSLHSDVCACTRVIGGRPEPQDGPMMTGHGSFICHNLAGFIGGLHGKEEKSRFRDGCVHMGFSSVAVIPIRYHERVVGAIHMADTRSLDAARHKVEFVETIAPLVGEAIHRFSVEDEARRYQDRLRQLAERLASSEEEDRWRISRYIHDTIIQNLSLSSVRLGSMIGSPADGKPAEDIDKLRKTRGLIDQAIDECRMVMTDLTPSLLYELGLVPALRELAGRLEEKHGAHIVVEDDEREKPMSNPLRGLLFESVRELVTNALKHAGRCEIRISVVLDDNDMVISVADDGKGYDPATIEARPGTRGGFGLFSVRQRLEGFSGRLQIRSTPGKGTVAEIRLPILPSA
ncbi:MAG: hypothetical protein C0404_03260 [Verrucomicrobia bacterium]|nr:hypothetical protein [Verrucomicrobiota bacterium]